jgi:hypothetical protein
MKDELTVLVNSTDSFEDCWYPFFKLFERYWPQCRHRIVLNTETKDYWYPKLNITASKVCKDNPNERISWGESLIRCLRGIDTEVILYLQDDYFLNDHVDVNVLAQFLEIMQTEKFSHIRLMELDNGGPWHQSRYPLLWEIAPKANYRINLQAGLWRKDRLRFYLNPRESAWQFERWGSFRAHRTEDTFYCQNLDEFNRQKRYIVPYEPTGIVRGKWHRSAVLELFKANGIDIDFSRRGFYKPTKNDVLVQNIRSGMRRLLMKVI